MCIPVILQKLLILLIIQRILLIYSLVLLGSEKNDREKTDLELFTVFELSPDLQNPCNIVGGLKQIYQRSKRLSLQYSRELKGPVNDSVYFWSFQILSAGATDKCQLMPLDKIVI